jgi:cytochrome P450
MERIATKKDVIPLRHPVQTKNGKEIAFIPVVKGQTVVIPIVAIHRLDSIWGDGNNFRPERWLEPEGLPDLDQLCAGWSNLLTFSDGPRNCIEQRLGESSCNPFESAH